MQIKDLFELSDFTHKALFVPDAHPWQPLNDLKKYMQAYRYPEYNGLPTDGSPLPQTMVLHKGSLFSSTDLAITFGDATKGNLRVTKDGVPLEGASVIMGGAVFLGQEIEIGKGVLIESGAMIKGPTIIDDHSEVRQGAYLRGYCLSGKRCILGHTTEVKHSIFLNDAKAGHFAYLGDSILGSNANLGAGTKFANLRFLPGNVTLIHEGEKIDTGLRKFGAILGDEAQTGCNSVTNPGTILGKKCALLPNTTAKAGIYKAKTILR